MYLPTYAFINLLKQISVIPISQKIELSHGAVEQKPRFLQVMTCTGELSRQITWLRNCTCIHHPHYSRQTPG